MEICIPSAHRAGSVKTIHNLGVEVMEEHPTSLWVPKDQYIAYKRAVKGYPVKIVRRPTDGLTRARNLIIDSYDSGLVLMLDDDLEFFVRKEPGNASLRKTEAADRLEMLEYLATVLEYGDDGQGCYAHAGISMRGGNNNFGTPYVLNVRCCRALAYNLDVYRPKFVTYYMQDFDTTLTMLRMGYAFPVLTEYAQDHGATQAEGGCSVKRTVERHAETCRQMAARHPDFVTVVEKRNRGGGEFGVRTDVRIAWKKAFQAQDLKGMPGMEEML